MIPSIIYLIAFFVSSVAVMNEATARFVYSRNVVQTFQLTVDLEKK